LSSTLIVFEAFAKRSALNEGEFAAGSRLKVLWGFQLSFAVLDGHSEA
jgi:hypothetical protein